MRLIFQQTGHLFPSALRVSTSILDLSPLSIIADEVMHNSEKSVSFTNSKYSAFNLIFKVTKNSSLVAKLLITIESILNIIWYSLISIFKNKK